MNVDEFARWVNENPTACPALWFSDRLYLEYAGNITAGVEQGDYMDLAHAARLPYVDAITLDTRIRDYAERTARKVADRVDYVGRVFPNLAEVVNRPG